MALQEEETQHLQSPALILDGLYCEEESLEEAEDGCVDDGCELNVKREGPSFVLYEQDLFWEDEELVSLISKEKETHFNFDNLVSDGSLMAARREAIEWVLMVKAHYGFSALTSVLAVNYFDRFISSLMLHKDKPWMGQLVAVACLSLAAKVDETDVPLLIDLQVSEYVFEAKVVKRMELLVLSTLQWRMNPVTPISFFDHIVRRLGLKTQLHRQFLCRCERLLLSLFADSRLMTYLPSTLATSIMLHVIQEIEPFNHVAYQNQLMSVLKISEDKVKECFQLILELSGSQNQIYKRKNLSTTTGSPKCVIDALLNADSSNESWPLASSVSSSPVSQFKRRRVEDQQMQLPSVNRMFVDVLSSPR